MGYTNHFYLNFQKSQYDNVYRNINYVIVANYAIIAYSNWFITQGKNSIDLLLEVEHVQMYQT